MKTSMLPATLSHRISPTHDASGLKRIRGGWVVSLWLLFLSACLGPGALTTARTPLECGSLLAKMDEAVDHADATDTSVFRIRGYPYLRTSRFLASMGDRLSTNDERSAWIAHLHLLDLEARQKEMAVLDGDSFHRLAIESGLPEPRTEATDRVLACSDEGFRLAAEDPELAHRVSAAIDIPSEYSLWRRTIGIYPLISLPVTAVSNRVFNDIRHRHQQPLESLPRSGTRLAYTATPTPETSLAHLFHPGNRDILGIPIISPPDAHRLAARYAPTMIQDIAADYDRIGAVAWRDDVLVVNGDTPTGYYYVGFGLLGSTPHVQISYCFWYSSRSGPNAPWFEHGHLDGLTVRINLDTHGDPFMVDLMNTCGCYHFFVPSADRVAAIHHPEWGPDTLVPSWLPGGFPENPLSLYVSSGQHQVNHIAAAPYSGNSVAYELRPYEALETLSYGGGQRRSMFDADGIAHGSGRIEPLLFFSMGIPAVGSMRQRGHHPIKLVGRAHFDDPDLFNQWFDFTPDFLTESSIGSPGPMGLPYTPVDIVSRSTSTMK